MVVVPADLLLCVASPLSTAFVMIFPFKPHLIKNHPLMFEASGMFTFFLSNSLSAVKDKGKKGFSFDISCPALCFC